MKEVIECPHCGKKVVIIVIQAPSPGPKTWVYPDEPRYEVYTGETSTAHNQKQEK